MKLTAALLALAVLTGYTGPPRAPLRDDCARQAAEHWAFVKRPFPEHRALDSDEQDAVKYIRACRWHRSMAAEHGGGQ